MESSIKVKGICSLCNESAELRCSLCRVSYYCSKDHQKKDWQNHKKTCAKPKFQIEENGKLGRFLTTSEDLKSDTLLFKDRPLVLGPKFGVCDLDEMSSTFTYCVGCYADITGTKNSLLCPKCKLPICNVKCCEQYFHKNFECRLFKEAAAASKQVKEFGESCTTVALESLLYLRCVLMKIFDETKYKELLSLQANDEFRDGLPIMEKTTRIYESLRKLLMGLDHPTITSTELSRVDCHKILGIVDTNGVDIKISDNCELIALYPVFSMLENTCGTPSCKYYFVESDKKCLFQLYCRSSRALVKGDHLSCTYTNILWNTEKRRAFLKKYKYFWCECERCLDPFELGTNFSTILCPVAECKSFCVPVSERSPIKQPSSTSSTIERLPESDMHWKCQKCGKICEPWQVKKVDAKLSELVAKTPVKLARYEEMLRKMEEIVHPNYYLNFIINHSTIQMLGQDGSTKHDKEVLEGKLNLCAKLLNIIQLLDPGLCKLNIYAGVVYYEMQSAILQSVGGEHDDDYKILRKNIESVKLAKVYLQKCIDCFQYELIDLPETKLKRLASKKMEYLNILLRK